MHESSYLELHAAGLIRRYRASIGSWSGSAAGAHLIYEQGDGPAATHILVREAYAMLEHGFHEEKIPPAET
jgi:hypothetical protein